MRTDEFDAALAKAADEGDLDGVKAYEAKGAQLSYRNFACLRRAAIGGRDSVVEYLAMHPDVNLHAEDDYAVVMAAANGHTGCVRPLRIGGANVLAQDAAAFRLAARGGHTETLKELFETDAPLPRGLGTRLLEESGCAYQLDTFIYLLDSRLADINSVSAAVLDWAADAGVKEAVALKQKFAALEEANAASDQSHRPHGG
jgi:hypothetical protein